MKKFFVVSDIHSFYTVMMETLRAKGYDENNPEHILIICGDLFDRGDEPIELYHFLKSLGDRFIFIRGNHEDLLFDCVYQMKTKYEIDGHHISNKTMDTVCRFLYERYGIEYLKQRENLVRRYRNNEEGVLEEINNFFSPIDEVLEWINTKAIDYYEVDKYIFVHGWIPVDGNYGTYDPCWRNADVLAWREARWLNGMQKWKWNKVKEPDKTIVCGHYHCSYGWSHIRQKRSEFPPKNRKNWEKSFEPFIDDGIIAIDACTAYSGIVNVFVFENKDEILDT